MAKIFISYSSKDWRWHRELLTWLSGGLSQETLPWSDSDIAVGDDWRDAIENAMQECGAAILLISPDFLNSPFIMQKELTTLLERRRRGEVRIFPLHVRHSLFEKVDALTGIEARPKDGPLDGRSRAAREKALKHFALEVLDIIEPASGGQVGEPRVKSDDPRRSRAPSAPVRRSAAAGGLVTAGAGRTQETVRLHLSDAASVSHDSMSRRESPMLHHGMWTRISSRLFGAR